MSDLNLIITSILALATVVATVCGFVYTHFSLMNKTKFFNEIVNRLAWDDKEAQLSAAILIRRFMATNKFNGKQLREDAINVVSSI